MSQASLQHECKNETTKAEAGGFAVFTVLLVTLETWNVTPTARQSPSSNIHSTSTRELPVRQMKTSAVT